MWLNKAAQVLSKAVFRASRGINGVGVAILAAMMLLTALDVIGRYVFNHPITGSLELTEFMMVILVAFGLAYTGMHKGHIHVDIVITRLPPKAQAVINAITTLLCLGVFALITWRSIMYGESLRIGNFVSSSLFIPIFPFAYLVALGSVLLCLVFLINLLENLAQIITGTRAWLWSVLMLAVIIIVALLSIPAWQQGLRGQITPVTAGVVSIVLLIVILFSGMLIGMVMAFLGFIGMVYIVGSGPALTNLGTTTYSTASSYSLSVIPLFVLMGLFCFYSGLTRNLYYTAYRWIGHAPGGLAMATIGAAAGFAAVSGSSVACTAIMGTVSLPEMKRYKYSPSLATGSIAAGGCIGILIPPSVILAIYGILTEQSIGKLFLAGFVPGILETILFMLAIYILCKRNPLMGPPGEVSSWKDRIVSLKDTWGVLLLFLLVIGGLYAGVFTPTEAAGVGAFGAFVIAISLRQLSRKQFVDSLLETSKTTAMVFVILIGANVFGYFLAVTRLPMVMSDYMGTLAVNRYAIIAGIIFIYLFMGCVMSSLALIVLTVPIFFPIIIALGFDPIWFGIIIVMVVEIGQLTPPVGINVFVMYGIAKDVPMYTIFRGIVPFFVAELVLVVLLVVFPQIATFIPSMMK